MRRFGPIDADVQILLLHGGPGMDPSYFFPYLMPLAKKHGLISYTQGFSGARNLDSILEELAGVLKLCDTRKTIVLGHSWGATLILEYLKQRRGNTGRMSALILCSWLYDMAWQGAFDPVYTQLIRRKKITHLKWESAADYRESMLKLDELYFIPTHLIEGQGILKRASYNAGLYLKIEKEFLRHLDHKEILKSLSLPILSLVGSEDAITNAAYVRGGASLNPRIKHVEISHAGHFPFVEKTDETNAVILDFIGSRNYRTRP